MNAVLDTILTTRRVCDGNVSLELGHPDFPDLPVSVDRYEGAFLQAVIGALRPHTTIEIGCAYGVSSLYICETLARLDHPVRHIIIDPFQSRQWRGIGVKNLRDAGFSSLIDFREDYSEFVLPDLARDGTEIQFAFVDGWHTFDQALVDFFYLNRMLASGGVIVFDDADRRSVNRVIRHALTYPAYEAAGTSRITPSSISFLGRMRRLASHSAAVRRFVRADVLQRDWDVGIDGSCVAIRKTGADRRSSGWDSLF